MSNSNSNLLDVAVDMMQPNTFAHETSKFFYQGTQITFQKGDGVMVNATEMARSFGNSKRPQFWLNTLQSKDYLNELHKARNLALTDYQPINFSGGLTNELYGGLVVTVRGGSNPGTWMHEDVALEFARWLSPAFAIWTNDRIKEILTTGVLP